LGVTQVTIKEKLVILCEFFKLKIAIRPFGVVGTGLTLAGMVIGTFAGWKPEPTTLDSLAGVRLTCEAMVASWFGHRISITK